MTKEKQCAMDKRMLAMMVALRVYREIVAPCVGCDAKKVGEGDVVKKIDIN